MAEFKSCNSNGFEYPHGTSTCRLGKCAKCVDGMWEETDKSCQRSGLWLGAETGCK
jgi:hypothetical protein